MLQNKLSFNQSAVCLEIIGLPDYSNDEKNDQISIISKWKLMIIDKPLIEGNIDHLKYVMKAFYTYSNFLINEETPLYESKLIDIKAESQFFHNILLKSSKAEVKPLNIKIGNSVLSDVINCFDQFNYSDKVKKIDSNSTTFYTKKSNFKFINKDKLLNLFLPPIISLCSLFIISSTFLYFNNYFENKDEKAFLNYKHILDSANSRNTLV